MWAQRRTRTVSAECFCLEVSASFQDRWLDLLRYPTHYNSMGPDLDFGGQMRRQRLSQKLAG
jgi:hypothetical protein